MKSSRTKLLAIYAPMLVVVGWVVLCMLAPVGGSETVHVQVPRGTSAAGLGKILAGKGIIRSAFGFRLLARMSGKTSALKPGAYSLSPGMTPSAILEMIAKGDVSARWVTIPEGFTVQQIGDRLQAEGLADSEKFTDLAMNHGASFHTSFSHPNSSLEGYLFPDTYLIPKGSSEEAIIQEMLKGFESKVTIPFSSELAASGWTLHDVVTLASLIEREARVSKDRPLVSSVLRNRLAKGMRLECDATVLYALGGHKDRVFYRDLEVDSPYNTYRNAGLPPGPIANPGAACIRSALEPARTSYYFYVARRDGSHIFTRNMADHERARATVRAEGGR